MTKEERAAQIQAFLADVDWDTYDYTTSPGADMRFPDFTEAEAAAKPPWIPKHYNQTSGMSCVHVPDLNQIRDGQERRLFALYGIPVEWPSRSDDPDALNELIDELDRARAAGGRTWAEAKDQHGLINDEHYTWLRGYKLGFPDQLQDYEQAKQAIVHIDQALAGGNAAAYLQHYGFRDAEHYQSFRSRVAKAKAQAWSQHQALLQNTFAQLDEQFQANKAALSGELAPFMGVSMEAWAAANAALSQGHPLDAVLAHHGIPARSWDEVSAEWNARMARDTTATIATVYGQAFMGAGQGQFGAAGQAAAASMQQGFGKPVADAHPISFEDWIKIQAHITAAAAQGVDPNAVLAKYRMNAADWGTAGGYWAMKMSSDPMQYLEQYQVLSAKYATHFASGGT